MAALGVEYAVSNVHCEMELMTLTESQTRQEIIDRQLAKAGRVVSSRSMVEEFMVRVGEREEDFAHLQSFGDVPLRENVDKFVWCLAQNGWLIIMQPPWFIDGQKVSKPPRFIPRGEWKYVSDNPESVTYHNVSWLHKISENIYRTKVIFTKKDEMNPNISISYIDINCADSTLRESKKRSVEKEPWKPVIPNTMGFFLKDKVCAEGSTLTQRK